MDLQALIAAYLISQGAHTGGHFYEANKQDVPAKMNMYALSESWQARNRQQDADINGAGFSMQDRVREMLPDEERKNVALANAIFKGLYLAGLPNKLSGNIQQGGDVAGMERSSGNKYAKAIVASSIVGDLIRSRSPDSRVSYGFDVVDGAPGGRVNFRW